MKVKLALTEKMNVTQRKFWFDLTMEIGSFVKVRQESGF